MMFFHKKASCPYPSSPCIALSRDETHLLSEGTSDQIQALVWQLEQFQQQHNCTTVYTFEGDSVVIAP